MINIPTALLSKYSSILTKKSVPVSVHNNYKKWLRFYLDFCHEYGQPYASRDSLKQYIVSERKRTFRKSAGTIFYLPIDNFKI